MGKLINFINLSVLACSISACGAPERPQQHNRGLDPEAQKGRIVKPQTSKPVAKQETQRDKKDEYVNRIAKRISVVSDQPETQFDFRVIESPTAGIVYDNETNSILVSSTLLSQLHDEAQLAAVLSLGVAKFSKDPDPDRTTVNNLYRAGYDPNALIELQEAFVFNNGTQYSWLGTLYTYPLSPSIIMYNKNITQGMPQGLSRNSGDFSKQTVTAPIEAES